MPNPVDFVTPRINMCVNKEERLRLIDLGLSAFPCFKKQGAVSCPNMEISLNHDMETCKDCGFWGLDFFAHRVGWLALRIAKLLSRYKFQCFARSSTPLTFIRSLSTRPALLYSSSSKSTPPPPLPEKPSSSSSGSSSSSSSSKKRMSGFPVRAGLGIVLAYTAYSAYMQIRTSYEISERARKRLFEQSQLQVETSVTNNNASSNVDGEQTQQLGHIDAEIFSATDDTEQAQFASMKIGGRYVNPFSQYRPQTVFEFVFCRIRELVQARPRGGVPSDPAIIAKLMPSSVPDYELLECRDDDLLQSATSSAASSTSSLTLLNGQTPSGSDSSSEPSIPPGDVRATLTWLGQSCAFVQLPGLNILTDPCLSEHLVSPYIGPKRIAPAPCKLTDLPPIDVVLVSHDHPDHFELEIAKSLGNSAAWVVPTGVGKHLAKLGISNYKELDWWETTDIYGSLKNEDQLAPSNWEDSSASLVTVPATPYKIACTPAMHWSGRKMIDSNETLWSSFMVLKDEKPLFFHAGDTGYSKEMFDAIRNKYGTGCQLAMLPCGAYCPRWHLRRQHIDPYEAMQIMKDLGAHKMVGVHWGTFVLSDEHFLEPRDTLHMLARENNCWADVIAPQFGKTLVFRLDHKGETRGRKTDIHGARALLMD